MHQALDDDAPTSTPVKDLATPADRSLIRVLRKGRRLFLHRYHNKNIGDVVVGVTPLLAPGPSGMSFRPTPKQGSCPAFLATAGV